MFFFFIIISPFCAVFLFVTLFLCHQRKDTNFLCLFIKYTFYRGRLQAGKTRSSAIAFAWLLFTANCNQIKEIKNIFPYEALSSCAA